MRIAVIADTHGRLPEKILPILATADEIWHLGDFCDHSTLNACIGIGRPFHGVLGNNDSGLDLPPTLEFERMGKRFHLVHIPPRHPPACDFLLFGHTHVPRDEQIGACRLLNPGTIGKPNKGAPPSWAWLEITKNGDISWKRNPV